MGWSPDPRRIFRWPGRSGAQIRREVDEELSHHLALAAEELERRGMTPDAAAAEARRRFGDVARARREMISDDVRFERRIRWRSALGAVREDLSFALRSFGAHPGHATLTVSTLAVGIAVATIFFGAVDSVLLQPVALDAPDRVVMLWGTVPEQGVERDGLAPATVRDIAERSSSFEALGAAQPHGFDVEGAGGPIAVNAWIVSEGLFDVLSARPAAGRLLGPADFGPGAEPSVVVTHAFWQTHLGGDPAAVGRPLALDGAPHVVVGVLPADFPERSRDLFVPRAPAGAQGGLWESRFAAFFTVFGRLRPGVSLESAGAELGEIAAALQRDFPEPNAGRGLAVTGLRSTLVESVRDGLWMLFAAAILILAISCVNAAGLLLARASARSGELAIRAAVGAGRHRLMQQLLTEATLLALLAAAVAVPLAAAGLGLFRAWSPPGMPRIDEVGLDPRTVAFATLVAFAVSLFVGLVPALRATRPDLYEVLKPGGRAGTLTPATTRLRAALVGSEVAIAVVLLVGGGLLLRSWTQVLETEQGYDAAHLDAVEAHYWQFFGDAPGRADFARRVVERLRATPGVAAAGAATSLPLAPAIGNEDGEIAREGDERALPARWVAVTPGLLEGLGVELLVGRGVSEADGADAEPVALLGREAARRLWPEAGPDAAVGEIVLVGADDTPRPHRVIGVVTDVRYQGLETPAEPAVYVPHAQSGDGSLYFVARAPDGTGLATLGAVLAELQPSLVLSGRVSLDAVVADARQPRRFSLMLLGGFGATALLLTIVGLFGHLSHSIRSREHELGVRMALGAWPGRLTRTVTRQGFLLVLAGAAGGLFLAWGLSRFIAALLYGVTPSDPVTFVATAVLVLGIGAAASYLPARRVSRVDPAVALRIE